MRKRLTFRRGVALLGAVLVFAQNAAQACPGCKQVDGAPLSGASVGFSLDIVFMLVLLGSLFGGFGYMMYQSCRALAARDRYLESGGGLEPGSAA
jgi:hypothetical protein